MNSVKDDYVENDMLSTMYSTDRIMRISNECLEPTLIEEVGAIIRQGCTVRAWPNRPVPVAFGR
ncbi:hypothetical protein AMK27_38395 [Streptomyces sp. CB02009]|uniref:hypothetical protein n=1 Tax=Streptomyces sp. CB02009 TaxID=1703938 RepID=UPI0009405B79|nr:hypothetical protein [Streptomyces sp. CB02009]OKJ48640.1 hypothetical protein AMK27_38395 [Streptomyces sp. CB02009]